MKKLTFSSLCAISALCVAMPASAQQYRDDEVTSSGQSSRQSSGNSGRSGTVLAPYIEASQIVTAQLSPGDDVVTYTQLAAGFDAAVNGRNNGGSFSLRYERNIAYQDNASSSDTLSGLARGYATLVPNALTMEAGGYVARTRLDGSGNASISPELGGNQESRIYSIYGGPNVHTKMGPAVLNANYRIGYTRVDAPDVVPSTPIVDPLNPVPVTPLVAETVPLEVFDDSISQSANFHLGTKAGDPLPVGLGVGGGWNREDVSNLDQRVDDRHVRGDISIPINSRFAVVGGVGYEDVEVSSRDVQRDANGEPVIGSDGRYVTDTSVPRQIAYEADGLIWDAGVVWRPSRRTSLQASVGRRYDSTTYYGSLGYAPDSRSSVAISVYDNIGGIGGQLTSALAALPTQFTANRNPLTGDIGSCVNGTQGSGCIDNALSSVRSSVFRSRGVSGSYTTRMGRLDAGFGVGYDRRKFIGAEGTVLAAADGLVDENYYMTAFLGSNVGRSGRFSTSFYANYLDSDFSESGNNFGTGASASYSHNITSKLSARAAIAVDHLDGDLENSDLTAASTLFGLRYGF